MVEGNDQSLEYIGYQVPRSELEANAEDFEKSNQTQGFLILFKCFLPEFLCSLKFNFRILILFRISCC